MSILQTAFWYITAWMIRYAIFSHFVIRNEIYYLLKHKTPADVRFITLQSSVNLQQQISDLTAEAAIAIALMLDILDFIEGGSPSVPQLANPEGVLAAVDASEISVVWDVSNADGYIIERSLSVNFLPNETEEVYNGDYGYGIFNDTDVIPQGHYFYRIKSIRYRL